MPEADAAVRVTALAPSAQLGGPERVLLDFANRAFEHDVALRVLTPRDGPLVRILKNIGVPTAIVAAPERMLKGPDQTAHYSRLFPAAIGLWQWSQRLAAHGFLRDADVVYSTAFKPHMATAFARWHPVVWHIHDFPPRGAGRMWQMLARRVPKAIVVNSEAVGDAWGKGEGGKGKRMVTIPNGVNLDRFKPAERTYWIHERLGIPRDHRLLGMPSLLARWKGQPEVIQAFQQMAADFPHVHLVIVGGNIYDTPAERVFGEELGVEIDRASTGEWAAVPRASGEQGTAPQGGGSLAELGLRASHSGQVMAGPAPSAPLPRVHLLPFQPTIEKTYPEFDLTVHYSIRPEPFGRVLIESMASGVPVIAADEGGPLEILGGGIGPRREAGWLAEPRNPEALADVLRSALALPTPVLQSIGRAGRRRAEDFYSWRRFAAELADVLKWVAGRGTPKK